MLGQIVTVVYCTPGTKPERDEEEVDASFKEGEGGTSLALTTSCLSPHHTAHRKLSARNTHLLSTCQEFTSDTYRSSIRG